MQPSALEILRSTLSRFKLGPFFPRSNRWQQEKGLRGAPGIAFLLGALFVQVGGPETAMAQSYVQGNSADAADVADNGDGNVHCGAPDGGQFEPGDCGMGTIPRRWLVR